MYNAKIKNIEDKISDVPNLATATAFTAVENKIPIASNLLKRVDYKIKVTT